jgi:3-oxoacyl-[acyl-carrier-protein] synthase-3
VKGVGHYLPESIVDNSRFHNRNLFKYGYDGKLLDVSENRIISTNEKIIQLMGIKERRYAGKDDSVDYMAAKAIENALDDADISADSLEGIIVATVTSEKIFPSTACETQKRLDIPDGNRKFYAFDVAAACAGYPLAISLANSLLKSGELQGPIAAVASERLSKMIDHYDINSPLFGDGAGAMIIGKHSEGEELEGKIKGCYAGSETLKGKSDLIFRDSKGMLRMPEGNKVMKYAVKGMAEAVRCLKNDLGWTNEDIDLIIPHQANIRILKSVAKSTGIPWEKVYNNIEKYGNMSSATCAVGLSEAIKDERIKNDSKVVMVSFGSGLVTSAVALEY